MEADVTYIKVKRQLNDSTAFSVFLDDGLFQLYFFYLNNLIGVFVH